MFKLGKDITLQCRGPLPGVEFVLEHDGEEAPQQFSEDGDFIINNLEGKGIGNYSCSYRLQDHPNIWSEPSDAVELVGAAGEWVISSPPPAAPPHASSCCDVPETSRTSATKIGQIRRWEVYGIGALKYIIDLVKMRQR